MMATPQTAETGRPGLQCTVAPQTEAQWMRGLRKVLGHELCGAAPRVRDGGAAARETARHFVRAGPTQAGERSLGDGHEDIEVHEPQHGSLLDVRHTLRELRRRHDSERDGPGEKEDHHLHTTTRRAGQQGLLPAGGGTREPHRARGTRPCPREKLQTACFSLVAAIAPRRAASALSSACQRQCRLVWGLRSPRQAFWKNGGSVFASTSTVSSTKTC